MSAKPDLWMPIYFGAYLTDTMHLKTEQHGAYFLLLMACWKAGGKLPDDDEQLAAITRMNSAQWKKARAVIAPFWQISGGTWTQKRLTRELEAARARSAVAKENGGKGGRPRKPDDNPEVNQSGTQAEPGQEPKHNPGESSGPLPGPLKQPLPRPQPSPSPAAHTRSGEIALLLRKVAKERGKTVRIGSIDKTVIDWAKSGITDEQLIAAFDLAAQDRDNRKESSAINPGFVDVFLAKLLNPGAPRPNGSQRQWHETAPGIKAKAEELGLELVSAHKDIDGGDGIDYYGTKLRIIRQIGDGPWVDKRNALDLRMVDEYEKGRR